MNKKKDVEADLIELDANEENIKVYYSFRAFFFELIPSFLLFVYSLFLYLKITKPINTELIFSYHSVYSPYFILLCFFLLEICGKLGKKYVKAGVFLFLTLLITVIIIKLFSFNINVIFLKNMMLVNGIVSGFYFLYYFLFVKTGFIDVNKRMIEINEGIFYRIKNSTDLSEIKDKDIEESPVQQLLGIATIKVQLNRAKEFIFVNFITKKDAERVYGFLVANAFSSYREYKITQDRLKGQGYHKVRKNNDLIDDEEDFDQ